MKNQSYWPRFRKAKFLTCVTLFVRHCTDPSQLITQGGGGRGEEGWVETWCICYDYLVWISSGWSMDNSGGIMFLLFMVPIIHIWDIHRKGDICHHRLILLVPIHCSPLPSPKHWSDWTPWSLWDPVVVVVLLEFYSVDVTRDHHYVVLIPVLVNEEFLYKTSNSNP